MCVGGRHCAAVVADAGEHLMMCTTTALEAAALHTHETTTLVFFSP